MTTKHFYASFIQARAYDKRYNVKGEKTMEVARVALDHEDYDNALKVDRYLFANIRIHKLLMARRVSQNS